MCKQTEKFRKQQTALSCTFAKKKSFVKSKPTPKKHKPEQKYRGSILNILQMDEADGIHASEIGVLTLNVRPE